MEIQKLHISQQKTDINLQFYFFLKYIVKLKPTDTQYHLMLENIVLLGESDIENIKISIESIFLNKKKDNFNAKIEIIKEILLKCNTFLDIHLFVLSLKLYQIKSLLLEEAKIVKNTTLGKLYTLDPLSLEYDAISILKPYSTRVNGALLSLLFFEKLAHNETNFMSENAHNFVVSLAQDINQFHALGLEANQIFMLMFSEVINQSIISDSGSNYETRILSVLSKAGVGNITKQHDKNDKSTEFDFFFEIDEKTYGIGAKRTLRERYKQFIKTALTSKIDIMIEITLGLDLNYEKAKTITSHGTYLFVADEIYNSQSFLRDIDKVYSVKNLNLETLKSLT